MRPRTPRLCGSAAAAFAAAVLLVVTMSTAGASDPRGATYCSATDQNFWFVHVSDLHIGMSGSTDADRLRWVVGPARSVINPSFIVATGDLTDSTNGNLFTYPNGPYQAEWDEYKSILTAAGVTSTFYYDLPGNHDAYNDKTFAYYRANSVQGQATGQTQHSWTREFAFGKYHFLGVNSSDNTGAPFSIFWPYGDYAGLDAAELDYIDRRLVEHADANLTLVFGHHPVTDTGGSTDTWLYYGHREFVSALDSSGASGYAYGHTHAYSETQFTGDSYTGLMSNGGVRYANVASLGKNSGSNFSVVAIDCDGLSSVTQAAGTWPVVLITAPVSKYVGSAVNPYGYTVPNAVANPIRALVFDAGTVAGVSFRVDGSTVWQPMSRVSQGGPLWTATWNATGLAAGEHTLEVRAVGTTTRSHIINVEVIATTPPANQPPAAVADSYSTPADVTLTVAAPGVLVNDSDPEDDELTAVVAAGPAHGTVALAANGSFTYVPDAGYTGDDSFTYTARDAGGLASNTAIVSLAITAPQPVTDTVTVLAATYTRRTGTLAVTATSSAQPDVVLEVEGFGTMKWNAKKKLYAYSGAVTTAPAAVTVRSSIGGSATKTVLVKK